MIIIEQASLRGEKVETYAELPAGETFIFTEFSGKSPKMKLSNGSWIFIDGLHAGVVHFRDKCREEPVTRVTIKGTVEYHE